MHLSRWPLYSGSSCSAKGTHAGTAAAKNKTTKWLSFYHSTASVHLEGCVDPNISRLRFATKRAAWLRVQDGVGLVASIPVNMGAADMPLLGFKLAKL